MSSLHAAALRCLRAADPQEKLTQTDAAALAWRNGELALETAGPSPAIERIEQPGRPQRPQLVHPRELPRRALGSVLGRAALIHAIAHIEFNAIDLAWDAVYRFRDMPSAFYDDWVAVAADEARHFRMLTDRLAQLGHQYGDFNAHNGLWEMALKTDVDLLARMALVPCLLEARGLDVTPGMIDRLRSVGDLETVAILECILREEEAHVAAGVRWFRWLCEQRDLDVRETFRDLLQAAGVGVVQGPFNLDSRRRAGFEQAVLDDLHLLAQNR